VTAGSVQRRPPLFISGKMQQSKFRTQWLKFRTQQLKIEGVLVIRTEVSGIDAADNVFFCLDSRTLGFDGSSLQQRKCFATEGLLLGDSESSL
jgi:hypothetical protein